nr:DUF4369 domain-containing protein [uncultured Bacteroides sp.]
MRYYKLSAIALIALMLAGCNGGRKKNYIIEGKVTNPKLDGRTVYMQDALTGQIRYDSVVVEHGTFRFEGKQDEPVVRELLVQENDSDMFPVTLPFVLENGRIEVDLGERVYVGNTALNKEIMDVLMAVDKFTEQDLARKSVEGMKADFANLLMSEIVKHSDNVIGRYLYDAYQNKLTEEQKNEAKKILAL